MLVFVSDVHLTRPHTKKYEAFLSLLKKCRDDKKVEQLFLCGDVFDIWLGHKSYFFNKHKDVVSLLKEISALKKVHIFEGNHDFHFKASWWRKHQIEIHKESYEFDYDNKKWFVCHGDLLNQKDYGYKFLRWYFRSWFAQFLIFILPGALLNAIGEALSTTEYKSSKNFKHPSKEVFLKNWENWIRELKKSKDFDVFVCGHYHVRLKEKIDNIETYNLGSWLGQNYKYFSYDSGRAEFIAIET